MYSQKLSLLETLFLLSDHTQLDKGARSAARLPNHYKYNITYGIMGQALTSYDQV